MYSLSAGQFAAGEYTYEAKVKFGDKLYSKSGIIVIKEIISEKSILLLIINYFIKFQNKVEANCIIKTN